MTVLSFPAVFTWQSVFGLTVDGDAAHYVVRSEADGGFYYPVGEPRACRERVRALMDEYEHLKLVYVPGRERAWLEGQGFEVSRDEDTSEYVYSSRALALLDGGAGINYRVKVRNFARDNVWRVDPFRFPEDEALLGQLTDAWEAGLPDAGEGGEPLPPHAHGADRLAVCAAARNAAAIGLSGIRIETKAGEWAFLLGYRSTPQIYDMSIVKYSPGISRNAVPACICEMAKRVCGAFPYVNLEDDMGDAGLRTMKRLYRPLFMLDSYTARR